MSSLDTLLGVAVTKALANTSYEKRKQAALELEKLVRELGGEKIKQILLFLREYVESPTPNIRKGGLIGLAAVAIGLDTHSFLNKDPAVGQSQLAAAGGVGGRGDSSGSTYHFLAYHLVSPYGSIEIEGARSLFWDEYIEYLVPPVLSVFEDEHPRVRYYACEALYNIIKVARPMRFFNEIFDAAGRHIADPDKDVKAGAVYLDKVLKDIVTETPVAKGGFSTFQLPNFMPLLAERIHSRNPFLRSFLLGWVQLLQTIPDLDLYLHLPALLPGLFSMLGETVKDIRVKADVCLTNFLQGLKGGSTIATRHRVTYTTARILVDTIRNSLAEMRRERTTGSNQSRVAWSAQLTSALSWLQSFVEFANFYTTTAGEDYVNPLSSDEDPQPFSLLPLFLAGVLPCLDSSDKETAKIAVETHSGLLELVDTSGHGKTMQRPLLLSLIRALQAEMSRGTTAARAYFLDAEANELYASAPGGSPSSNAGRSPAPGTSTEDVVLKTAALQWLCMLLSNRPEEMLELSMDLFDPLFQTLTHPDTEVVIAALQVLARIMTESRISAEQLYGKNHKIGGGAGGDRGSGDEGQDVEPQVDGSAAPSGGNVEMDVVLTPFDRDGSRLGPNRYEEHDHTATSTPDSGAKRKGPTVTSRTVLVQSLDHGGGTAGYPSASASAGGASTPSARQGTAAARTTSTSGGSRSLSQLSRTPVKGTTTSTSQSGQELNKAADGGGVGRDRLGVAQLFQGVCRKLLDLFRVEPQMFDQRGRLVIRQLCDKLDAELFFRTIAAIVLQESALAGSMSQKYRCTSYALLHRQFLGQAVEIWHWILLTGRETAELRERLLSEKINVGGMPDQMLLDKAEEELLGGGSSFLGRKKKVASGGVDKTTTARTTTSSSGAATATSRTAAPTAANSPPRTPTLFTRLLLAWISDPLSAVSLAIWCGQDSLAEGLCLRLAQSAATCSENFLNQLDQFVQLFESPVFLRARMRLLEGSGSSSSSSGGGGAGALVRTLVSLCMMLPQCTAFDLLQKRVALCGLNSVSQQGTATAGRVREAEKESIGRRNEGLLTEAQIEQVDEQLRLHAGDLITQVAAQKTVASLGDPCDCNQNHDYWQTMIDTMLLHLHPELPNALFTIGSASQAFFSKQSCIWSSDNEDSHRLAALSDCIPGFVSMKISCVTHLVWKAYEAISASADPESDTDPQFVEAKASVDLALGHMAEVLRTAAF
eukprot:g1556.t1